MLKTTNTSRINAVLLSIIAVATVSIPTSFSTTPTANNSINTIAQDMQLPHEGKPHGVPASYNWATKPRLGMGNKPGNFQAITAWGQVYEDAQGNPAKNTRVQIRNIRTYVLSKKGKWQLVQSTAKVQGSAFREDFAGDANQPANVRTEADGSVSVKAGGGYNYHFWPAMNRATINPQDIAGVYTTVQSRLIVDNAKQPDDRDQAKYLLSMGADYWQSVNAQWKADWSANGDVGIGRFKYVRKNWQAFNMTTLSEAELRKNPPPLNQWTINNYQLSIDLLRKF